MADARLSALSVEALGDAVSVRNISAQSVEALTDIPGVAERRVGASSVEALSNSDGVPERQLAVMSIEVLVPRRFTFVGWGAPISSATWS